MGARELQRAPMGVTSVKEDTTYGLSPEQLARLMALGLEETHRHGRLATTRQPAQAVQEILTSKLPLNPANPDSLPAVLKRSCDEFLPLADQTIRDLVMNRETDLALLKSLKDYAKQLVRQDDSEGTRAAATVLYYSAIASALVFHRQKISQHSYQKLDKSFTELGEKLWVPPEMKELFKKARLICRHR